MNAGGAPGGAPPASEGGEILHRLPAGYVRPAVPPRPGLSGRAGRSLRLGLHAYLVLYAMHLALPLGPGALDLALQPVAGGHAPPLVTAKVGPHLTLELGQLALGALAASVRLGRLDQVFRATSAAPTGMRTARSAWLASASTRVLAKPAPDSAVRSAELAVRRADA